MIVNKVVKQIRWSMGHRLVKDYPHKCRNAHGHEYLAEIEMESVGLNEYGFVLDFAHIKNKVKKWIDDHLDHGFLVCEEDYDMAKFLDKQDNKYYIIKDNPTAENIAKLLQAVCEDLLNNENVITRSVTVWETPNSYAKCERK